MAGSPLGPQSLDEGGEDFDELARDVVRAHRDGLEAKRLRDVTAEKYLLYVDGEGDGQWAEVVNGSRVVIPPNPLGGIRKQENMLRPVVENAIAYHTAQPFAVAVPARSGRKEQQAARISSLFGNEFLRRNDANLLAAEAQFFAFVYGFCPIHVVWRRDQSREPYRPIFGGDPDVGDAEVSSGFPDAWVGSPWQTVFGEGAKKGSFAWFSYERYVPVRVVRDQFRDNPAAQGLTGDTRSGSASTFQRIRNRWSRMGDSGGTAEVSASEGAGDDMVTLVIQEVAAGVLPEWPRGRLTIVALDGTAKSVGDGASVGKPILLHVGELPGGVFSMVPVYASLRGDDVYGKPWIADMADAQANLNQYLTLQTEVARKLARPPLVVAAGSLAEDTAHLDDDALLEVEGGAHGGLMPQYMYPHYGVIDALQKLINERKNYIYQVSGWQAASRGESQAGDSGAKVAMLAQFDDNIHMPINQALKASVSRLCQRAHALAKEYMTVPMLIESVTGSALGYLAKPYIASEDMLDTPPEYIVTSGYGATPEQMTQKLQGYLQLGLITPEEFWERNPDQTVRDPQIAPNIVKTSRVKRINEAILEVASGLRQSFGQVPPQMIAMAAQAIMQTYPVLIDDDPAQHVAGLSELTQDTTVDPLAQQIAGMRQMVYFQRMMQMGGGMMTGGPQPEGPPRQVASGGTVTPGDQQRGAVGAPNMRPI